MAYKAFISYSHAADGKLAPALQLALHRFAKTWYRRRAIRVFRDKTSLAVTPTLWSSIETVLKESEYFILLASPEAAKSHWVQQEVDYWLRKKAPAKMLIVLTDGSIVWDHDKIDFDWTRTTALPENLRNVFSEEPFISDLKWAKTEAHLSLRHPEFRDATARLAAPLHGKSLDDISGEDVIEHRKFVRAVKATVTILAFLTISASVAAYLAYRNQKIAVKRMYISIAQALTSHAQRSLNEGNYEQAALLARQSFLFNKRHKGRRLTQVDGILRKVLEAPYFSVKIFKAGSDLTAAAIGPNSEWLAVAGDDQNIRLWHLKRNKKDRLVLTHQGARIRSLSFVRDSKSLVAVSEVGDVIRWQYPWQHNVPKMFQIDTRDADIASMAISTDGQRLAAGLKDGSILVWSLLAGHTDPIVRYRHQKGAAIRALAFDPSNSEILASGGDDQLVKLWNLGGSLKPIQQLAGSGSPLTALTFSPDGKFLAAGTDLDVPSLLDAFQSGADVEGMKLRGGKVVLWNLGQPPKEPQILGRHEADVAHLAFHPSGEILASVSSGDRAVRLWHVGQERVASTNLVGSKQLPVQVAFSPDGHYLVSIDKGESATHPSSVRLWNMRMPPGAPKVLTGHNGPVRSLVFSHSGENLLSVGSFDGTVRLWDIAKGGSNVIFQLDEVDLVSLTLSSDGQTLAIGSKTPLGFNPDFAVRLLKLNHRQEPAAVLRGHGSSVEALAFSFDGRMLASAGESENEIRLWNLEKLNTEPQVLKGGQAGVLCLAFSPAAPVLAWGNRDKQVRLLKIDQAADTPDILSGHTDAVLSIAFGLDGELLISGDGDSNILLWRPGRPAQKPTFLRGHTKAVNVVTVDRKGERLASGSADGTVRIWDLTDPGADPVILSRPGEKILSLAFSPNEQLLAAGSDNHTIILWLQTGALADLVCDMVWRNLSSAEWNQYIGRDVDYECTCQKLPAGEGYQTGPD